MIEQLLGMLGLVSRLWGAGRRPWVSQVYRASLPAPGPEPKVCSWVGTQGVPRPATEGGLVQGPPQLHTAFQARQAFPYLLSAFH